MTPNERMIDWLIRVCLWQYEIYLVLKEQQEHAHFGIKHMELALHHMDKAIEANRRPRPIAPGTLTQFEN